MISSLLEANLRWIPAQRWDGEEGCNVKKYMIYRTQALALEQHASTNCKELDESDISTKEGTRVILGGAQIGFTGEKCEDSRCNVGQQKNCVIVLEKICRTSCSRDLLL
ncbi:uncharacterized protein LOC141678418 [Apium graveolens]|uniref:uncharacterized protein LOC141678418 n=1 Tax=Apium graveolens TaxID=4045 RepID=UPI003D79120D